MNSYHQHRFTIAPRDPGWNSVLWLRALTEPPPFINEDDWPLIEHIRATGQLLSGSMVATEAWFDRPLYEGKVATIPDRNAAERHIATEKAWRETLAARRASHEALVAAELKRRKAKRERIAREREQWEMQQELLRADDEARRLVAERKAEQKRRDAEWEAETERLRAVAQDHEAAQRAHAQRIEFHKQLAGMRQRFKILNESTHNPDDRRMRLKSHIMEVARTSKLYGFKQMKVAALVELLGCTERDLELCCYELGLGYVTD